MRTHVIELGILLNALGVTKEDICTCIADLLFCTAKNNTNYKATKLKKKKYTEK